MKFKLLFALQVCAIQTVSAQSYEITFEGDFYDTYEGVGFDIEIDALDTANVWQIGIPNKTFFDSAYSAPNLIVTDTVIFYPVNNESSFTLGFELQGGSPTIDFMHKFDTDSGFDGGYVEFSFDQGSTWTHLTAQTNVQWVAMYGFSTSNFYNETDTLQNGKPAFTGKSNEWMQSTILFQCNAFKTDFSFQLRFTFSSDSNYTEKEGWMIDNFIVQNEGGCWGIGELDYQLNRLKISPNPFSTQTAIEIAGNYRIENGTFNVFDMFGRKVSTLQNLNGKQFVYTSDGLKTGIYSYHLIDANGLIGTGKFVVN
jgi:hypothetical protein